MSECAYWNQMYANACDAGTPFVRLRPSMQIDGDQWCALYGDNLQDGVAAFGATPSKAEEAFNQAWLFACAAKGASK